MKHCTTSIGWYIGKFIINISGIMFLYWGLLKENDIECYCGAVERESQREPTEKNEAKSRTRCKCYRGYEISYPCGCVRNLRSNPVDKYDERTKVNRTGLNNNNSKNSNNNNNDEYSYDDDNSDDMICDC